MLKAHLKTLTAYMVVHLQSNRETQEMKLMRRLCSGYKVDWSASSDCRKRKLMIIITIMISAFCRFFLLRILPPSPRILNSGIILKTFAQIWLQRRQLSLLYHILTLSHNFFMCLSGVATLPSLSLAFSVEALGNSVTVFLRGLQINNIIIYIIQKFS